MAWLLLCNPDVYIFSSGYNFGTAGMYLKDSVCVQFENNDLALAFEF